MKKCKYIFILFSLMISISTACIFVQTLFNNEINIFVSVDGSDTNDGSKNKPFRTLERARDIIRLLLDSNEFTKGTIKIYIREGTYYVDNSLVLDERDSGNDNIKIIYTAYRNEEVVLSGSSSLDINDFEKVTDKNILNTFINKDASSNIVMYNLKENNISYGNPQETILNSPELFLNDNPMTLSRWPNEEYLLTEDIILNPEENRDDPFIFTFNNENNRTSLWENTDDIFAFGYWYYNWQDDTIEIDSIEDNQITTVNNSSYGVRENQRFYFVNILEELDSPNEYYIDRTNGILYFYPPTKNKNLKLEISQLNMPFIIMNNVNNITFKGITFEYNLENAIEINNSNNILLNDLTIRNLSKKAVVINYGYNVGVINSHIYNTGTGGIYIEGGDRETLTPSNHYVKNTEINNFSRLERCYSPAIELIGVGTLVSNNLLYDSAHTALLFYGNDHTIEYNEIHSVGLETDDVGAIYSGRDWTYRGNKINYNYFHDIGNDLSDHGIGGIYLDDCMSSAEIYGNIFYKVDKALFIGGGRDHIISNNLILDCNNSIYFDDRGLIWNLELLYARLKDMPYKNDTWENAYPNLYNTKIDDFALPSNNIITNNLFYKTNELEIKDPVYENGIFESNEFINNFINIDELKSYIKKNYPSFKKIPFNKIGLKK